MATTVQNIVRSVDSGNTQTEGCSVVSKSTKATCRQRIVSTECRQRIRRVLGWHAFYPCETQAGQTIIHQLSPSLTAQDEVHLNFCHYITTARVVSRFGEYQKSLYECCPRLGCNNSSGIVARGQHAQTTLLRLAVSGFRHQTLTYSFDDDYQGGSRRSRMYVHLGARRSLNADKGVFCSIYALRLQTTGGQGDARK